LVVTFWQFSHIWSVLAGAPTVMAKDDVIIEALKMADLKKGETLLDLGSGNGQVLKIANQRFGANSVGIETSPFYWLYSRLRLLKQPQTKIIWGDFLNQDLQNLNPDLIYCYLLPNLMEKVFTKLKPLKIPFRLVSVGFPIKGLSGKTLKVNHSSIYFYHFNP
jgi:SAM-dependent methyltransferase